MLSTARDRPDLSTVPGSSHNCHKQDCVHDRHIYIQFGSRQILSITIVGKLFGTEWWSITHGV